VSCCSWPSQGDLTGRHAIPDRDTAAILERAAEFGGHVPQVIAGHHGSIASLPGPRPMPGLGHGRPGRADLLEEMVQRTLDDDGQVTTIREAPFSVAAKLCFPVAGEGAGR
jgi:hypothetical protein